MLNAKKILLVIILINSLSSNCASFKQSKKRDKLRISPDLVGCIEASSTPIHNEELITSPSKKNCPFSLDAGLKIDTDVKTDSITNINTHGLLTCPSSSSPQFLTADLIELMQSSSPKNTKLSSASSLSPSKIKLPSFLSIKTKKLPSLLVTKPLEEDQSPKSATLCLALDLLGEKNIPGDSTLNIVRQDITPLSTPTTSTTKPANPYGKIKTKRSRIEIGTDLYTAMLTSPRISPEIADFLTSPNVLQKKS